MCVYVWLRTKHIIKWLSAFELDTQYTHTHTRTNNINNYKKWINKRKGIDVYDSGVLLRWHSRSICVNYIESSMFILCSDCPIQLHRCVDCMFHTGKTSTISCSNSFIHSILVELNVQHLTKRQTPIRTMAYERLFIDWWWKIVRPSVKWMTGHLLGNQFIYAYSACVNVGMPSLGGTLLEPNQQSRRRKKHPNCWS